MESVEVKRIIDQLERLYASNWPGINLQQMLDEITEEKANSKLPGFKNTIHQIARHIIADVLVVTKRLQGIDHQLKPDEDWVPNDVIGKYDWSETKRELMQAKASVIRELQNLQAMDLDRSIIKDYSTIYVTLHGHIQHCYYHIGQISVLYRAGNTTN